MFVMIWPDADKAYNFCCDRDKVEIKPKPPTAQAKETLATQAPAKSTPCTPASPASSTSRRAKGSPSA